MIHGFWLEPLGLENPNYDQESINSNESMISIIMMINEIYTLHEHKTP